MDGQTSRPTVRNNQATSVSKSGAFSDPGILWITEFVLYYDEKPFFTVSIMEFEDGKVVHETQYFGEPFEASAWRSQFVERIEK